MPGALDHVLFLVLAVVFPVRAGLVGFRRLQRAAPADVPRVKLRVYRQAMLLQWTLVASVALLWLWMRRPWSALGLVPRATGGLAGVLVGLAVVVAVMLRQGRLAPEDDEALEKLRQSTRHLERMLPATRRERSWFFGLALTAGFCEEVLYRGYVIAYLLAWFAPALPHHGFLAAAVAASLVFGAGHAYQGPRGVLVTAGVGGFLAAVYWLTHSLFAGMLVHALMDLHAGYVSHAAWSRVGARGTESEEGPAGAWAAESRTPDADASGPPAGGAC
jgi:membrane protease YdiL (CAAX protease family)